MKAIKLCIIWVFINGIMRGIGYVGLGYWLVQIVAPIVIIKVAKNEHDEISK